MPAHILFNSSTVGGRQEDHWDLLGAHLVPGPVRERGIRWRVTEQDAAPSLVSAGAHRHACICHLYTHVRARTHTRNGAQPCSLLPFSVAAVGLLGKLSNQMWFTHYNSYAEVWLGMRVELNRDHYTYHLQSSCTGD